MDASKTVFVDQTQVLVVTEGTYYSMEVAPKDSFGNTAIILQDHLTVEIREVRMELEGRTTLASFPGLSVFLCILLGHRMFVRIG